jgi:hypothetical protein
LVIGKTNNINPEGIDDILTVSPRGVECPQREFFLVKDVRFYNFDFNTAAAIGTCSHCLLPEDVGAYTSTLQNLWYDETVTNKFSWNYPGRAILYDVDGTTTGRGSGSWATPYFIHNHQSECTRTSDLKSLLCDNSV